jgi:phospholipase D3/4
MEILRTIEGVAYTEDVLVNLVTAAEKRIDLMAMYWSLLTDSEAPSCSDLELDRLVALGAEHGRRLFGALEDAARRGVQIRVLQSPGFRDGRQESDLLAAQFPTSFQVRQVDMTAWYGSGIMHQKLWLFDEKNLYLGSANMDWRSLSQVKELGLVVEDHCALAADLGRYFEVWWHFAGLAPEPLKGVWDPSVGIARSVPPWSSLRPEVERSRSPLDRAGWGALSSRETPISLTLEGNQGEIFMTGSPPELCVGGRTCDLDALLETVRDAERRISVSVMTYSAVSRYRDPSEEGENADGDPPTTGIWWPVLNDALLRAVITGGAEVRLLVSEWTHTHLAAVDALKVLQLAADAALRRDDTTGTDNSGGRLEIKLFRVPGWDQTEAGPGRLYPGHSRVNHPKFVVTDRRLHLSTSNMTWSYFSQSAGCSLNTDQPDLVAKAQEIFDRDWSSAFAHPLMDVGCEG